MFRCAGALETRWERGQLALAEGWKPSFPGLFHASMRLLRKLSIAKTRCWRKSLREVRSWEPFGIALQPADFPDQDPPPETRTKIEEILAPVSKGLKVSSGQQTLSQLA